MQAAALLANADLSHLSKSVLAAYAQDLEERLAVVGHALHKAQAVAMDAIKMEQMLRPRTDEAVMDLAICTLDAICRHPEGAHRGMELFNAFYLPVITGMNQEIAQQEQFQQFQQQQFQQPQQQYQSRASFPAQPEMGTQQGEPDFYQVPPHQRYLMLDRYF